MSRELNNLSGAAASIAPTGFDKQIRSTVSQPNTNSTQEKNSESQKNALQKIYRAIHEKIDNDYYQPSLAENAIGAGASILNIMPFAAGLVGGRNVTSSKNKGDGLISAEEVHKLSQETDLKKIADSINNNAPNGSQAVEARHLREFTEKFSSKNSEAFKIADINNNDLLSKEELDRYIGGLFALKQPENINSADRSV